jgi:sporulation protein YqfC
MAGRAERFRRKLAETLELPKDVVMDVPKVTIVGCIQLNIENHRGIIEYSDCNIRINTSIGVYKIKGSNLVIKNIVADEIIITGNIQNIDFTD